jgi:hypothetical protein
LFIAGAKSSGSVSISQVRARLIALNFISSRILVAAKQKSKSLSVVAAFCSGVYPHDGVRACSQILVMILYLKIKVVK